MWNWKVAPEGLDLYFKVCELDKSSQSHINLAENLIFIIVSCSVLKAYILSESTDWKVMLNKSLFFLLYH